MTGRILLVLLLGACAVGTGTPRVNGQNGGEVVLQKVEPPPFRQGFVLEAASPAPGTVVVTFSVPNPCRVPIRRGEYAVRGDTIDLTTDWTDTREGICPDELALEAYTGRLTGIPSGPHTVVIYRASDRRRLGYPPAMVQVW